MKRFLKRCCVVAMAAAVSLGVAGLFTGCGKEDPNTFTIWIGSSVNSSFYNDYRGVLLPGNFVYLINEPIEHF